MKRTASHAALWSVLWVALAGGFPPAGVAAQDVTPLKSREPPAARPANTAAPRANRIRVGGGFQGGAHFYPTGGFRYPSPLLRSVFPSSACYGIYRAAVRPGAAYALNMRLPRAGLATRLYLADRWPLDRGANLRRLPFHDRGSPLARGLYRWRFGIAAGSYGSVVYIVAVGPWLCGHVPPGYGVAIDPWEGNQGYGGADATLPVMQADGPMQIELAPGTGGEHRPGGAPRASMPLPGDIIGNPDFSRGLLDWQAISGGHPAANADFVRSTPQGIALYGTGNAGESGVRQNLEENVARDAAVILQATLRVTPPARAGEPAAPALTIEICYGDTNGYSHCGSDAFRRRFEALPPGTAAVAGIQRVPRDGWYRETFDLLQLQPRPARLDSITLLAPSEPGATAWVRDVHLLVRHK